MAELRKRKNGENIQDSTDQEGKENLGGLLIGSNEDGIKWIRIISLCAKVFEVLVGICLVAALFIYMYLYYTRVDDSLEVSGSRIEGFQMKTPKSGIPLEEDIAKKFPGFFRDESEQNEVEKSLNIYSDREGNRRFESSSSRYNGYHYHGCCQTAGRFITPVEGFDITKRKRKIVQLSSRKQFFYHETSSKLGDCQGCACECRPVPVWVYALYETDDETPAIGLFNLSVVYKCLT